jgi:toxin ParE1/3/4
VRVRWTWQAAADLAQICGHIEKDNPEAALDIGRRIYRSIEMLRHHPYRGRAGRVEGTRELVLSSIPYIGVYEIVEDAILVLRILHGARRWP